MKEKKMKKLGVFLLAILMIISCFAGCGKPPAEETPDKEPTSVSKPEPENAFEEPVVMVEEEGRLIGIDGSSMAASFNIKAEWIPFEYSFLLDGRGIDVTAYGNKVYVLHAGVLSEYAIVDGVLLYLDEFLPEQAHDSFQYSTMCIDNDGVNHLAALGLPFIGIKDGAPVFVSDKISKGVVNPSGTIGADCWLDPEDVELFSFDMGIVSNREPWEIEAGSVTMIAMSDNHIFACGTTVKDEETGDGGETAIFVHDMKGDFQMMLGGTEFGSPDNLASTTAVIETKNGFMATDRTWRGIYLWKLDGTFIGKLDLKPLLGDFYARPHVLELMEDGSIIIALHCERDDNNDTPELMIYRLTGF